MRPFFPYYGSTWNRARYLPPPRFDVVCEPFAGAAGYSTFYDVERAVLIDKDPIIAGVWRYLLRVTSREILALPELPNVGDSVDNYPSLAQEARWLIGFWLNRGSAQPKRSRTAYSSRTDRAQLTWGARAKQRIAEQLPRISRWSIVEGDYTLAMNDARTWLVDAPYVERGSYYATKFREHDALAGWCRSRVGQCIVLEGEGADWLPFEPLGRFKTSRGSSSEYLWVNA